MMFGGLRGAVGLALALLVDGEAGIPGGVKKIVNIYTAGIVIMTLVINGMAAGVVYKKLRPYPDNDYQQIIAVRVMKMLGAELLYIVEDVKDHWFHRHASWDAVKDFAPDFEQSLIKEGALFFKPKRPLVSEIMSRLKGGGYDFVDAHVATPDPSSTHIEEAGDATNKAKTDNPGAIRHRGSAKLGAASRQGGKQSPREPHHLRAAAQAVNFTDRSFKSAVSAVSSPRHGVLGHRIESSKGSSHSMRQGAGSGSPGGDGDYSGHDGGHEVIHHHPDGSGAGGGGGGHHLDLDGTGHDHHHIEGGVRGGHGHPHPDHLSGGAGGVVDRDFHSSGSGMHSGMSHGGSSTASGMGGNGTGVGFSWQNSRVTQRSRTLGHITRQLSRIEGVNKVEAEMGVYDQVFREMRAIYKRLYERHQVSWW